MKKVIFFCLGFLFLNQLNTMSPTIDVKVDENIRLEIVKKEVFRYVGIVLFNSKFFNQEVVFFVGKKSSKNESCFSGVPEGLWDASLKILSKKDLLIKFESALERSSLLSLITLDELNSFVKTKEFKGFLEDKITYLHEIVAIKQGLNPDLPTIEKENNELAELMEKILCDLDSSSSESLESKTSSFDEFDCLTSSGSGLYED